MRPMSLAFSRKLLFLVSFFILFVALLVRASAFHMFLLPFIFGILSLPQYFIGRFVDRYRFFSRVRPWLHLLPTLLFSTWFIWNYNFWRVPEQLFQDHLLNPIPSSVFNLKGYEAKLDLSWKANLCFDIAPRDFQKILRTRPFQLIQQNDPRFAEVLDQCAFYWNRLDFDDPKDLVDPELYVDRRDEIMLYYLLTNGKHNRVYFQKLYHRSSLRKYLGPEE